MPERIYKLQPNRTLSLRGFDSLGASAALHSATENSFKVSGTFRDTADFAVLILHDADNFYEHPRIKYLPAFDFSDLTLTFEVSYSGLMSLDSPKYASIDWRYLDFELLDGTKHQVNLLNYATSASDRRTPARAEFTVLAEDIQMHDRVAIFYSNCPPIELQLDRLEAVFGFAPAGPPGTVHSISVRGASGGETTYNYVVQPGDVEHNVVSGLAAAMSSSTLVTARPQPGVSYQLEIKVKAQDGTFAHVRQTHFSNGEKQYTIYGYDANGVAAQLAAQFQGNTANALIPLTAQAIGSTIRVTATKPGEDGNMLSMYAVWRAEGRLRLDRSTMQFTGGSSDATWRVSLPFSSLQNREGQTFDVSRVRQMWLTFAPRLANAAAMDTVEWEAVFSNWTVTAPNETKKQLRVAGPDSVRMEETDSWCSFEGDWKMTKAGFFYSDGFARETKRTGAKVTIRYHCPHEHEVYLGTSLAHNRALLSATLDGGIPSPLDCSRALAAADLPPVWTASTAYGPGARVRPSANARAIFECVAAGISGASQPAWPDDQDAEVSDGSVRWRKYIGEEIYTRRRLFDNIVVPPGQHTVVITVATPEYFAFDFLEAAVPSDVPDPLPPQALLSPALDYSTDHTYKLSAARLHWIFDRLGFRGPMNEYVGVFWWNQRKRVNEYLPQHRATFNGSLAEHDRVRIEIAGFATEKEVHGLDTPATVARWFANYINAESVALWASCNGAELKINLRAAKPSYQVPVNLQVIGKPGACSFTLDTTPARDGTWEIDTGQSPALNRGARDWHMDMFRECKVRDREIVVAMSMELVNPAANMAAMYPDGTPVGTQVGFGSLISTHCAFVSSMLDYQKQVYGHIADLQASAGLVPRLQFGEFSWWYFTSPANGGMAYYHPEIKAGAQARLGRALHVFTSPADDPDVNSGADALYLRNLLRDHVASLISHVKSAHGNARFELLYPYDVNYPVPAGVHLIGGRLNRFLNLPVEWESKQTCQLDRIKTEALDFGAWSRNLDLARTAFELPLTLGWPRDSVRHLVAVFRGGYPWEKELEMASAAGVESINLWAFDHVCLYGWPPLPKPKGRAVQIQS